MVARVEPGDLVAVAHDPVRLDAEATVGVFQEDPIQPPRPALGVRVPEARPLESVESVGVFRVLVAGGEVGVRETRLLEVPVRWAAGAAVEVPCYYDRRRAAGAPGQLPCPLDDELATLPAGQPALVVEVRVQVQEGEFGPQNPEQRPVGGADNPRPPAPGVLLRRLAEPETP